MKKQFFSFFLLISLFVSVSAQTPKPDATEQRLRTHVNYLASERLEGRRTGERGATFAAGYVANLFANYKLKGGLVQTAGGKTKTGFLQPFPYVTDAQMGANNRMMVTTPNSNEIVSPRSGWMPFAASPNVDLTSIPAIFVGYGIISDEPKYDDYAGLDAVGRIAFAFDGSPESGNPHGAFQRFNVHAKAKLAKEKGALALVLISREKNFGNDKIAAPKYDATLGETAIPVAIVSRAVGAALLGAADEKGLQEAESLLVSRKDAGEVAPANPPNRREVKIQLKVDLKRESAEAYNVVGILEGADAVLKNEAIIVGAHYDHLGRGGAGSLAANSIQIHHGADDNASGVAALLELARVFSREKKNKRTIVFLAFGGEEEGLLGSKFYVNNPAFPLVKTVAMINMDMVGRLKDNKLTIGGVGTAGEWKRLIETRNLENNSSTQTTATQIPSTSVIRNEGAAGVPTGAAAARTPKFILSLNEDGFGPSDHSSFYGKQIPVLFFFTGTHADYHKPSDTAEKINYAGLDQITDYVAEIVKSIDQNPQRPTYAVAKSSGMSEGRRGFNVSLGTIPSYSSESNDGLVLDGVRDGSPAAKAGIKAGDKIVSLAGREIRSISDYTFVLGELKPDAEYTIVVVRDGEKLSLKIIPARR